MISFKMNVFASKKKVTAKTWSEALRKWYAIWNPKPWEHEYSVQTLVSYYISDIACGMRFETFANHEPKDSWEHVCERIVRNLADLNKVVNLEGPALPPPPKYRNIDDLWS